MKKKNPFRAAAAVFVSAAVVWAVYRFAVKPNEGIPGETNIQRTEYIQSFGWETPPVPSDTEEIRIPARFDEAYEQYNALQKEQGFDLSRYRSCYARKFTYKITNYNGSDPAVPINANLIVYEGKIIAADISSAAANGFVTVLAHDN